MIIFNTDIEMRRQRPIISSFSSLLGIQLDGVTNTYRREYYWHQSRLTAAIYLYPAVCELCTQILILQISQINRSSTAHTKIRHVEAGVQ